MGSMDVDEGGRFTQLTERLGPEEAYGSMDQVYKILSHKVHDFGCGNAKSAPTLINIHIVMIAKLKGTAKR